MMEFPKQVFVSVLKAKAAEFRAIASRFDVKFSEREDPKNGRAIKFTFERVDEDLMHRFLSAVPHEVFAKRGFVGRIS